MLRQTPCEKSTVEKDVIGLEFKSPQTKWFLQREIRGKGKDRGARERTEEIRLDSSFIEFTLGVVHQEGAELTSDPDNSSQMREEKKVVELASDIDFWENIRALQQNSFFRMNGRNMELLADRDAPLLPSVPKKCEKDCDRSHLPSENTPGPEEDESPRVRQREEESCGSATLSPGEKPN
ncbi:Ribosomal RNA large subunit methyltransferase H [Dissostichus eleginoides]|uniref:Ribosomal RNA large subunit methyltransferase H n=1 Tax=Dissostichus eleginoides TaxID=100907 RepID=A0AAD9CR05_DISEL|nr:Ribosomal RNA large subunit methyltransferase H [Dissostichus eleginoides]